MSPVSDAELLVGLRARDGAAWEQALDRYGRLIWSIARSFGLDEHDAADITQICFAELVAQVDRIRDGTRLGPWLATVARRHTWRRSRQRRRDDGLDDLEPAAPSEAERRIDDLLWIDAALARLDERCRRLIEVLYLSGAEPSYDAVSRALGMPIGSIGPTRARCLAHLERILVQLDRDG